jgi:hypothetical protein
MPQSPNSGSPTTVYRSYLVRLWQSNEQGVWRASAQCVQTGDTILFGDRQQLLAFLQTEMGGATSSDAIEGATAPTDLD